MDLTLLFFLPLIGGFLFVESFALTRFRAARQETQRLYYKAALYGVVLSLVGLLLHYVLGRQSQTYRVFAGFLRDGFIGPLLDRPVAPGAAPYSTQSIGTRSDVAFACVWALLLGASTPVLNLVVTLLDRLHHALFTRRTGRPSLLEIVNARSITDQFEMLLATAVRDATQLQVTLSNQKVYVGTVTKTVEPRSQEKYVRLLPFMSGFRSKDTGEVVYNVFYTALLEARAAGTLNLYEVVVPMDKIVSASGFDLDLYYAFQKAKDAGAAPPSPRAETALSGEVTVYLGRPLRRP